jgi:UDP-N-acetylmuramate--alanine ligase
MLDRTKTGKLILPFPFFSNLWCDTLLVRMAKSNIKIGSTKSVHKYETVNINNAVSIAGKRFHFIGAGGIGMSGLAKLLIKHRATVTGSDQTASAVVEGLCRLGADVKIGHRADNLPADADAVVISAAVKEDNIELKLARQRKLKIYKYAEMLGIICNCYEPIAVAGTHGKSTTSGWLVYLLKQAGLEPSFVIGAEITQLHTSSGVGEGSCFVAEACEYDRSFLNIKPKIACILNIEADHLDYYRDEAEIVEAFEQFAKGIKPGGVLIANGKDANVAKIMDSHFRRNDNGMRCETFGLDENCNFYVKNLVLNNGFYSFDVYHNGELLGPARITLPGGHNVLNALAVVAAASCAGLPAQKILELLPDFRGVDRRLTLKAQVGQITVLDDYAHHPTEIKASLAAIRQRYRPRRIWCIFQPHQYSRTRFLLEDFAQSFKFADITIVPEIYFVRDSEAAKKQINSQVLVDRIRANGAQAIFIDDFGQICDYLKSNVAAGELVVTMGAGDIWKVADEYIQWLRKNH